MMKAQLKEHLSLSKKDWNGMLVLITLILLVIAAPYVYQWYHKDTTINSKALDAAIAEMNKLDKKRQAPGVAAFKTQPEIFKFDPNTASSKEWQQLGLTPKQAAVIDNYRAKGGKFYKPADLKKIYGISDADYKRLAPYISLKELKTKKLAVVELNTADSARLTTIEGVGPSFARRIVYYRQRLGGFVRKEQLKEVAGLDELKYDEIKDQVKVDAAHISKMNINSITSDKLRLMPYLTYKQVNAIIEYRNQHGNYTSIDDLRNIPILDDVILRKIEPYLNYR